MDRKNKLSKVLLATVAIFALATSAFAIPKGPCEQMTDEVCCKEPPPGPFAFSYAKDIGLSCPRDFYFNAAFLLMQAREGGLEYAVKQSNVAGVVTNSNAFPLQSGDIQGYTTGSHSTDWNYGVRLDAGFYLNHDAWDLNAAWTYFRINNDKGLIVNGGVMLPFWLDPGIQVLGNVNAQDNFTSSARWTANLNTIDLRLGKPYHISRYVIFNPHFGVRFGHIAQDYMVRNGGSWNYPETVTNVDMIAKNNFWGIGARAGLDTEWHVGAGWFLFGKAAAALLYSHFDVAQSVTIHNAIRYQIKHDFYTVTPNTEIHLGVCWSYRFSKNRYLLMLKGAYEFHAWFDQNRMRRFFDTAPSCNDEVSRANLYLSGFSFALGFEF